MNATAIRHNLEVFRSLRGRRDAKLTYDRATGQFSIQSGTGINLQRAWNNLGKSADEVQSVTNAEMFSNPIRETFAEAVVQGVSSPTALNEALEGLRALRTSYNGQGTKLAVLNPLLAEIDQLLRGSVTTIRDEFLQAWNSADPANFFSADDLGFLRQLYRDADVMNLPLTQRTNRYLPTLLREKIYRKYNEAQDEPIADRSRWVNALPTDCKRRLQDGSAEYARGEAHDYFDTFMHFYPKQSAHQGGQLWRVYLNCTDRYASAMLSTLTECSRIFGIKSFKVGRPDDYHTRSDKIVVYLYTRTNAVALAQHLSKTYGAGAFHNSVPAFVLPVAPGIGIGVEPEQVQLGFEVRDRHSFGSIRSKLLASAILHYYEASCTLHEKTEMSFLKWAVVAFSGYHDDLEPEEMQIA